jgi:sugar diacid utilization regulator
MAADAGSTSPTPHAVVGDARLKSGGHDEAVFLRKILAMCGRLSALASQNVELSDIADFLFRSVGSAVAVLDRGLEVLACAGLDDLDDVLGRLRYHAGVAGLNTVLAAAARNRRALTVPALTRSAASVVVAPVSLGEEVVGYLVTLSGRDDQLSEDIRLLVTEHAAMVCGIVLGRDMVVAAAAGRARQELIEGLLLARDRDDGEVDRWARHLGFDPSRPYYVLAVTLADSRDDAAFESAFTAIETLLSRLAPDAIVASRADEVVAVVPITGDPGAGSDQGYALANACRDGVAERDLGPVRIGIGNRCETAADVARSYAEARRALAASGRMGEFDRVVAFADLGIHRLLLRVPNVRDLRGFAEEVMGKLLEGDEATSKEYLTTLAVYFHENGSPRRAAQRLHVHPNTVSYRIRRVEEITGLSLDVHRDRLMAEVAVEILGGLGRRR